MDKYDIAIQIALFVLFAVGFWCSNGRPPVALALGYIIGWNIGHFMFGKRK